jgi:hypothetical protein
MNPEQAARRIDELLTKAGCLPLVAMCQVDYNSATVCWLDLHLLLENRIMSDVFFTYVSDDASLKNELAAYLESKGITTVDKVLRLGDNLSHSVEEGLRSADYGVIILSRAFFRRPWPRQDLDRLAALDREFGGKTLLMPIWHEINQQDVARYSPSLASRLGVSSAEGLERAAWAIAEVVQPPASYNKAQQQAPPIQKGGWSTPLADDLPRLRDVLVSSFSLSELRDLCFDLGIDFEDVPGETRRMKVIELIGHLQRRGRLEELIRQVQVRRPQLL